MAKYPYNTSRWQKLRALKLSRSPICEICCIYGKPKPANAVDHIVPISAGGAPFPPLDELRSMCVSCHNYKTNVADRTDRQSNKPLIRGCRADGSPADVDDPWHRGASRDGNSIGKRPVGRPQKELISSEGL